MVPLPFVANMGNSILKQVTLSTGGVYFLFLQTTNLGTAIKYMCLSNYFRYIQKMASFQDSPDEVILKVLTYLDINELVRFGESSALVYLAPKSM